MLSMTGFGKAKTETDELSVEVEIRAVNNRFLKCQVKCPAHLKEMESPMDAVLRARIHRGSVTTLLRVTDKMHGTGVTLNTEVAESLLSQTAALAEDLGQTAPTLSDVLRLPGVVTTADSDSELTAAHKELIVQTTDAALVELISMRTTEGAALAADLTGHLIGLRDLLATMVERAPLMVDAYSDKLTARLKDRLKDLSEALEVTPSDIIREVALFTDRSDISEELQ